MVVRCKQCNMPLTGELREIIDAAALNRIDGENLIPKGFYFVSDGEIFRENKGKIIINKSDLINAKNHSNYSRLNGCCGLDGMDGINKVCLNEHEIATECSDCWMPHCIIFESSFVQID